MIKTVEQLVKQKFGLWALPNRDTEAGEFPFKYEIYGTTTHWNIHAIYVTEVEVSAMAPAGIDLMTKAHETLDKRQEDAKETYDRTMEGIAKDRQKLYLLEAPPAPEQGVDLGDGQELMPEEPGLIDQILDDAGFRSYGEPIDYNNEE